MSLTKKEVLEDAQELVVGICEDFEKLNLTGQDDVDAHADTQRILLAAAEILGYIVTAGNSTIH
jgi:hypothetical protein